MKSNKLTFIKFVKLPDITAPDNFFFVLNYFHYLFVSITDSIIIELKIRKRERK